MKNIENDSYIKNIFGAYKGEEKKDSKNSYEIDENNEIIQLGDNCIRL